MPDLHHLLWLAGGVVLGASGLLLAALLTAAGRADDHDERTRGIRRS